MGWGGGDYGKREGLFDCLIRSVRSGDLSIEVARFRSLIIDSVSALGESGDSEGITFSGW